MQRLPAEVIHNILQASGDLQVAIDYELLHSGIDRRFYYRIQSDPKAGPICDDVVPLLPNKWIGLTAANFPVSLAISRFWFVVPHDNVATVPAFKVAWIAKFRPDLFTFEYVMKAARAGRLDLIRLLDAYRVPKFCKGTFDEAAAGGHLSMLKFLYGCGRYGGCSAHAVDKAARGGHLDVIKWLHKVQNAECTDQALSYAVRGGNLEVVKYLQNEMDQVPSLSPYWGIWAWWDPAEILRVEFRVVRLLHEEFRWPMTPDLLGHMIATAQPDEFRYYLRRIPYLSTSDTYDVFRRKERWLPMLKILHEFHGDNKEIWVSSYWDELARQGHADMLEFLYEHRREGCTKNGLSSAAQRGHVRVVKLLIAKDCEVTRNTLEYAVLSNSVELLKFCRSVPQLDGSWDQELARYAAQYGRYESLRWLWEELGLGLARFDFLPSIGWDYKSNQHVDVMLYAVQEKNLPMPDQPFLVKMLEVAARSGSLERCPKAFLVSARQGRLDVVKFLCETRAERPSKGCLEVSLEAAATEGKFEVVRYLLETVSVEPTMEVLRCAAERGDLELVLRLVDRFTADEIIGAKLLPDALDRGHIEVARFLHQKGHTTVDRETMNALIRSAKTLDIIDFVISNGYHTHMDLSMGFKYVAFNYFRNIDITERCFYEGGLRQSFVPGDDSFLLDNSPHFFQYNADLIRFVRTERIMDLDLLDPYFKDALTSFRLLVSWNVIACTAATAKRAAANGSYQIIRWLSRRHPHIFTTAVMAEAITSSTSTAALVVEFLLDHHLNCWDPRVHTKLEPGTKAVACLLAKRGAPEMMGRVNCGVGGWRWGGGAR
ncbi:hypothetical protein HDU96_006594 [Phlyctochytrium bullatum]|nr:hypothetical protein HDU96_006594 [Phlyctochytrium bullatum]